MYDFVKASYEINDSMHEIYNVVREICNFMHVPDEFLAKKRGF